MDNIVCFFYLLMRDYLPTGEVAEIIQQLEKLEMEPINYTNKHLEAYAKELVGRLFKGEVL